jgi:hypothetical protein
LRLKTKANGLLVVWPQNHWDGFLWFGLKTGSDGFLRFNLKTGGDGFLRFDLKIGDNDFYQIGIKIGGFGFFNLWLKIGTYGLVICASKLPRQFFCLGLKTKWAMVCRLRLKINLMMRRRGIRVEI